MAKLKLQSGEEILATDFVQHYINSLIAYNAECYITNKNLILIPKTALDRLTGKELLLPLSAISGFDIKDQLQVITHSKGELLLSGGGGTRVVEHLKRIMSGGTKSLSEKIIFQSDADVYIKGQLSTKGEVILSNKKLIIRSKQGLESLIFSGKSLESPLTDIKNVQYSSIEKKLTVTAKQGSITLGGKAATKLNSILHSLEGSTVDALDGEIISFSALLLRGAKPSINGDLSITNKRIVFTPQNAIDTLTGVQLQHFPVAKIQKLKNSSKLVLGTNKSTLEFSSPHQNEIFEELYQRITHIERVSLFDDIRSKQYSEESSEEQLKSKKLPFSWSGETPILCENVIIQRGEHDLWFGHILMTSENTIFMSHSNKPLWKAKNASISIVENRSSRDVSIELLTNTSRLRIFPLSDTSFAKFYRKKLKDSKPSEAEQFSKGNQPIQNVTGITKAVILSVKNQLVYKIANTVVKDQTRGLQIEGRPSRRFPLELGDRVEVEIPKDTGRYLFQSVIVEEFLTVPDPVGRYYLTLATPKNISVYNDRTVYRAPFEEIIQADLYVLPEYDPERDDVAILLPKGNNRLTFQAHIKDLSVGGCGFIHSMNFTHFDVPNHRLLIKMTLIISGQRIAIDGLIRHQHKMESDQYISGLEFVKLDSLHRSLINRTVLQIEREELRKKSEEKEI